MPSVPPTRNHPPVPLLSLGDFDPGHGGGFCGGRQGYQSLNDKQLAKLLLKLAANVDPKRFRSHPRKPKVKKKIGYASKLAISSHVSTARLLTKRKKSP